MNDVIFLGGSVKAIGGGKVAGYLIQYSTADAPDLSKERDFFTADCDYDLDTGNRKSVFYSHGLDAKMGVKRIGVGEVKQDEIGVWIEAQLNMRDSYEQAIYKMAEDGKLGWSSGAPSHLVTRKAIKTNSGTAHKILSWPLAEASLTPCPADHRNQAVAFKSLPMMIGIPPIAKDHTVKTLPSGMSYDDMRALLQDELDEDIGDGDDADGPGLWITDIYDDAVVYRDEEDLMRVSYTVTSGNDVVWGVPESVVRTTVYVTATDSDDDINDADTVPPMAGKQADVTALKAMLRASMTLDDHATIVQDAMGGFVTRAERLADMSVKSGRAMSASRHAKLAQIHAGMTTAHTAMAGHLEAINNLLLSTDPDKAKREATKEIDEIAALRMQHLRRQSRLRAMAI